jgi:hypothetical protein
MDGELSLSLWSSYLWIGSSPYRGGALICVWRALPIAVELFLWMGSSPYHVLLLFSRFPSLFFTISFLNATFHMWTVGKYIATSLPSEEDFPDSEATSQALSPQTMPVRYHIVLDVNGLLCNAESGAKG